MTDPAVPFIDATSLREWRDHFAQGRAFSVPLDRALARRRLRGNTVTIAVCALVVVAALAGVATIAVLGWGRALTLLLLAALALAAALVLLTFAFARRRVRAVAASGDEYLHVARDGLRVAGEVAIPWSAVIGGVGTDDREAPVAALRRPAAAVSRASGVAQSELVLGLRGTRALRDAASPGLRGMFEVIFEHGGMRIPLDAAVSPDAVAPLLAAVHVAAAESGVRIVLTHDYALIRAITTDVLSGRAPQVGGPPGSPA